MTHLSPYDFIQKKFRWISEPGRSRCWILILFWKPSFKFQKCLYTCKAAAAVAQSSLVGCKIFRPSWDVKLVLLGPRHPFFFDPFFFFFLLLRSSICPFYSDFYVKTIGSPHLFVNVTHTIHWDSETFQWTLAKHWKLRDGHSWNWIFHHMCILTCTCRQHS